jgi:cyclopropane fatty-acyl-phospholipid synthase-like methyltransferase
MHVQAHGFIAHHATTLAPARVLEIGSLDVNGSVRTLFPGAAYHGIDVVDGPGVDEVADAADWHASTPFDVVVSTEVLEHAPRWRDVVANAWEALGTGGVLLLTCATDPREPHSAVDGWALRTGEWYGNIAPREVISVVATLRPSAWSMEVALDRGDLYLRLDRSGSAD